MESFGCVSLWLGLSLSLLRGSAPEATAREALVVEGGGQRFRVGNLRASGMFEHSSIKEAPDNSLLVYTDSLKVLVPLSAVVSMERTNLQRPAYHAGTVYSVVYLAGGHVETIVGGLHRPTSGIPELTGDTLIGDRKGTYRSSVYRIGKLTFDKDSAQPVAASSSRSDSAVLHCLNGRQIPVWNLVIHSQRDSAEGYLIGQRTLHAYDASVAVGGESAKAVIPFSELSRIIFNPLGKAHFSKCKSTVLSLNGRKYLAEDTNPTVFSGEFAGGRFSIESDSLRQIDFVH